MSQQPVLMDPKVSKRGESTTSNSSLMVKNCPLVPIQNLPRNDLCRVSLVRSMTPHKKGASFSFVATFQIPNMVTDLPEICFPRLNKLSSLSLSMGASQALWPFSGSSPARPHLSWQSGDQNSFHNSDGLK